MTADSLGGAVADIFRLEADSSNNWKIVEHWDVLQAVPENCINPHPMF
jgi:predicted SnoaL-like aldol condensation-catalyzing enzyme